MIRYSLCLYAAWHGLFTELSRFNQKWLRETIHKTSGYKMSGILRTERNGADL